MSKTLIFQGKVTYLSNHWYENLIFPLVQVKKLLQTLYNFLLHLIWSELIYGKKLDNEIAQLVGFIFFCLFSLFAYYLQDYIQILLIISFLIWYLDRWVAKQQYYKNNKIDISVWTINDDEITCSLTLPGHDTQSIFAKFNQQEIHYLGIAQNSIIGGAFEESWDKVWQTEIYLYNGKHFLIDEHQFIHQAIQSAQKLANNLNVEIIVKESQGNDQYVEQILEKEVFPNLLKKQNLGVKCYRNPQKWHIYTQWHWTNSWQLIKQIFQKAGFLIFLLIMAGFMIQFGELLHNIILIFQGKDVTIYFPSPLSWFNLNWNWRNLLELAIALGVILYQGWQLSRVKHIYLNKHYLTFAVDNQVIDKLRISDIKTSLVFHQSDPELLIIGSHKTIQISYFQSEHSARVFWHYLDEGINFFSS